MLIDQHIKICYVDKDWPFDWSEVFGNNREEAKIADIIISRDGKVLKERFCGYNFILNSK